MNLNYVWKIVILIVIGLIVYLAYQHQSNAQPSTVDCATCKSPFTLNPSAVNDFRATEFPIIENEKDSTYEIVEIIPEQIAYDLRKHTTIQGFMQYKCFDKEFIGKRGGDNVSGRDIYKVFVELTDQTKKVIEMSISQFNMDGIKFDPKTGFIFKGGQQTDPTGWLNSLSNAMKRGVYIVAVANFHLPTSPSWLRAVKYFQKSVGMLTFSRQFKLYTVNMSNLKMGGYGTNHNKSIAWDRSHIYIGSNNKYMAESKENGIIIRNNSVIANSVARFIYFTAYVGILQDKKYKYENTCKVRNWKDVVPPKIQLKKRSNQALTDAEMKRYVCSKNGKSLKFTWFDIPTDRGSLKAAEKAYGFYLWDDRRSEPSFAKPYKVSLSKYGTNRSKKECNVVVSGTPPIFCINGRQCCYDACRQVFNNPEAKSMKISAMEIGLASDMTSSPYSNGRAVNFIVEAAANMVLNQGGNVKVLPSSFLSSQQAGKYINPNNLGPDPDNLKYKEGLDVHKINAKLSSAFPNWTNAAYKINTLNGVNDQPTNNNRVQVKAFVFGPDFDLNNPPVLNKKNPVNAGLGLSHAKYGCTDKHVYISTSNFSYENLMNFTGHTFICDHPDLVADINKQFDRDWASKYTIDSVDPVKVAQNYKGNWNMDSCDPGLSFPAFTGNVTFKEVCIMNSNVTDAENPACPFSKMENINSPCDQRKIIEWSKIMKSRYKSAAEKDEAKKNIEGMQCTAFLPMCQQMQWLESVKGRLNPWRQGEQTDQDTLPFRMAPGSELIDGVTMSTL